MHRKRGLSGQFVTPTCKRGSKKKEGSMTTFLWKSSTWIHHVRTGGGHWPFFSIYFQKKNEKSGILAISPKNVNFSDFLAVLDPPRGSPRTTFGVIVGTFWGNFGFDSGYLQDLQTKQKQLLFLFVSVKRNSKNMCVCVERVLNAVNQMNQNKQKTVFRFMFKCNDILLTII